MRMVERVGARCGCGQRRERAAGKIGGRCMQQQLIFEWWKVSHAIFQSSDVSFFTSSPEEDNYTTE